MQLIQSRLATFSTLVGVDQNHIKQFMKDNLKLDKINGRYFNERFVLFPQHISTDKSYLKELGHEISKTLSEIKKYQDQRDDRSLLIRSIFYLNKLKEYCTDSQLQSIEPNILFIRDQYEINEWIKVPFHQYDINSDNLRLCQVLHNVHQSEVDPMMIAYYPTLHHLRIKKEIRTKLGKYLSTFREYFNLSEADIKSCVEAHASFIQSRKGWNVKFIESNDPNGWIDVYKKSQKKPRSEEDMSCMTDSESVQVYANDQSVLRLAYMMDNETILARCIVREDEKAWIRVYPDPNGFPEGRFLLDTLKSLGYEDRSNLNGVYLSAILKGSKYLAPYIDFGNPDDETYQRGSIKTLDGKDYIIVGHGDEFELNKTDGLTSDSEMETCDDCDERCDESETVYSEYHNLTICEYCRENYYFAHVSRRSEDYIHQDYVIEVRGEFYLEDCLSDFDIYRCEESDTYYPIDELHSTSRGFIHETYCLPIDHENSDGNNYAHQDDVATLSDGSTCDEEDMSFLQDELDEEEKEGMIIESSFPNQSTEKDQPNE